jgi:hypothetical protein
MPLCTSWTATIARLSFCVASQDNRLPTPDQAAVVREVLDIRKRQTISASTLERLKSSAFARKPAARPLAPLLSSTRR